MAEISSDPEPTSQNLKEVGLREAYLIVGEKLINDQGGLVKGLDVLSVAAVVRSLNGRGVKQTRGAFHSIWATRDLYLGDLLFRVLRYGDQTFLELDQVVQGALVDEVPPFNQLVNVAGTRNYEEVRESQDLRVFREALGLRDHETLGEVVTAAVQAQYDTLIRRFVTFYRYVLPIYRLKVREPLTVHDLVVALAALIEGFAFTAHVNPDLITEKLEWEETEEWNLFTVSVLALLDRFTEPMPDPTW